MLSPLHTVMEGDLNDLQTILSTIKQLQSPTLKQKMTEILKMEWQRVFPMEHGEVNKNSSVAIQTPTPPPIPSVQPSSPPPTLEQPTVTPPHPPATHVLTTPPAPEKDCFWKKIAKDDAIALLVCFLEGDITKSNIGTDEKTNEMKLVNELFQVHYAQMTTKKRQKATNNIWTAVSSLQDMHGVKPLLENGNLNIKLESGFRRRFGEVCKALFKLIDAKKMDSFTSKQKRSEASTSQQPSKKHKQSKDNKGKTPLSGTEAIIAMATTNQMKVSDKIDCALAGLGI